MALWGRRFDAISSSRLLRIVKWPSRGCHSWIRRQGIHPWLTSPSTFRTRDVHGRPNMTPSPSGTAAPFDPRSLYSSNNTNSTSTPAKPPQASSSNGSASVKREQGASIADDAGNSPSSGGKKKPSKRRKVNLACIYCRRSHMTCDEGRPCQRCIKRDIGHLCHDEATPAKANEPHEAPASSTPSKPKTHASASTAKPATEVASTSAPTTSATLGQ